MKKIRNMLLWLLSLPIVYAIEVVEEPQVQQQSMLAQTFGFFAKAWKWMLLGVIILILGMVIYYLFKKLEDERKERDEPGYQVYKSTKKACMMQADSKKIRKTWSPINLLWLGFPIIKNEHSAKFLDLSNRILGYYRGEAHSMDNSINYLAYKRKYFIFFEESFVIKIPCILKFKSKNKSEVEKTEIVDLTHFLQEMPNGDIKIDCLGLERLGLYYHCPVFKVSEGKGNLDYRKVMEGAIIDTTYQTMLQRIVNAGAKMMEKATLLSPSMQAQKMGLDKTKEEQKLDTGVQ